MNYRNTKGNKNDNFEAIKHVNFATFLNKALIQRERSKMQGKITSFRRSIKRTSQKHMIISVDGVTSKDAAEKLVGKKVTYNTGKKDMHGKVASPHGAKGAVRAIFETGMPGQAIGGHVKID